MISRIIEFSAKNRIFVLLCTAALMAVAVWCIKRISLDAIPDLSDTQVIIYSKWDRSPDIIEDQVTYPIVTALLGAPRIKAVRGISDFGYSYVYVIFEDQTNIYWARSRVLEYLNTVLPSLPAGVKTQIGPDASSVGWIYQYVLVDDSGKLGPTELRSLQDFHLRFLLQSVPGVAEVASLGGYQKQYQVSVDPDKLAAWGLNIGQLATALRASNDDSGARVLEMSGREYMLRLRGYLKGISDIEKSVVGYDEKSGQAILLEQVANVALGPEMRRGVTDYNGLGDHAGAIVVMRQGENVLKVTDAVKARLEEAKSSLPPGVRVVPTYDRSTLVMRAIDTLKGKLLEEMLIVSLVILFFLRHIPSAIVPIVTIPISVLLAFIPLYLLGISSNIMSLAGIAISIGVLVDGAIVEVENAYKKLELWLAGGRKGDFHEVRLEALKQVGPSVFFSLLIIAVSFLPVFMLVDQEGRLFHPLAISKTLAMLIAALLALTLDPALRMLFTRMDPFKFKPRALASLCSTVLVGTYHPEHEHPVSGFLFRVYEPVVRFVLAHSKAVIFGAILLVFSTVPVYFKLGTEFMPQLNEESFLYMPTALPGMSVTEARRVLEIQDRIISEFPEVASVHGKAGRAETATDPAPFSMMETVIELKPQHEWPPQKRWYSDYPQFAQKLLSWTVPPVRTYEELRSAMDQKLQLAGVPNIWTMPIKNRIDMLSTGIRTPLGIKILGPDLKVIQGISERIEKALLAVPGTASVFGERAADGYYIDVELKREALARYGLPVVDAEMAISMAFGGENLTYTVEGRERYSVNLRYARDFRQDVEALKRLRLSGMDGQQIPLEAVADIRIVDGPAMIRNENGLLAGFVYIDLKDRDPGSYVTEARKVLAKEIGNVPGYSLSWSGQFENMQRVKERMKVVLPITILLILFLLYCNLGSLPRSLIVLLAVPFSLIGAVWILHLLGYHVSVAVWVGMIALAGLDAETGVFMLLYLDLAREDRIKRGELNSDSDLKEAIVEGAVHRIRPKLMTVAAAMMGLMPIMFSTATGADVMKRIAAPMIGGLVTSFALELLVYPAVYYLWQRRR